MMKLKTRIERDNFFLDRLYKLVKGATGQNGFQIFGSNDEYLVLIFTDDPKDEDVAVFKWLNVEKRLVDDVFEIKNLDEINVDPVFGFCFPELK